MNYKEVENIGQTFYGIAYSVYNWIRQLCKEKPKPDFVKEVVDFRQMFRRECRDGHVDEVKSLLKRCDYLDVNEGLVIASAHGHVPLCEFLIEKGADNLNDALKISCMNNRYCTAELLTQKGADTTVGLRASSSVNIIRMLYRYEQGGEVIEY